MFLAHIGPRRRGVPEQQLVELRPGDLPRLGRPHLRGRGEVSEPFEGTVGGEEGRPPLRREPAAAHQALGPDGLERVVHRGEERLADVKAREAVALEQHHPPTGAREPSRGR